VIIRSISDYYAHIRGMPTLQAKFLYLELVRSSPFYGSAFFKVEYEGFWTFGKSIYLSISYNKIEFVHETSKEVLMVFSYDEIRYYYATDAHVIITISRPGSVGPDDIDDCESYDFISTQSDEIIALIREYAPTKQLNAKSRTYSDQEILASKKDFDKAREALLECGLLRVPGPETSNSFLKQDVAKGSLLVRTRKRMSRMMLSSENLRKSRESLSPMPNFEYSEADWSFSRTKLLTSILAFDSGFNYEDFAIRVNSGDCKANCLRFSS
jgi:hypothetical protein